MGEPAVGLEVDRDEPPFRDPLKEPGNLRPNHPVPGVHDDREGSRRPDEPGHRPDVVVQHRDLVDRPTRTGDPLLPDPGLKERQVAVAGERDGVLPGELEPVHLPGEVGGRHHRPAVEPPGGDRVVEERGAHHPDIGDLRPGLDRPSGERPGERCR